MILFEDKEANLLDAFRNTEDKSIFWLTNSVRIHSIIQSLRDDSTWYSEWIDNSAKDAPPPDFVNDRNKTMLEVMRIDDHAFEQGGRIKNPTNQKARMIGKEISKQIKTSIMHATPNTELFINAPTDLPSQQDHNYTFYKNNFKRIIEKHKKSITLYKRNHPDHTLVFFVFDESSMYCQTDKPAIPIKGKLMTGELHLWFFDKEFLDVVVNSGIDFLIWFTPYKDYGQFYPQISLPKACVIDCNSIFFESRLYNPHYMTSTEE